MVMEQQYQKPSYKGLIIWMFFLSAVMIWSSIGRVSIAGLGAVKSACVLMLVMLDLLILLICLTGKIYWMSGISYEAAAEAGKKAGKKYARIQLAVFLTGTAVYLAYCFAAAPRLNSSVFRDSMAAGAVVCLASVVSNRVSLGKS